MPHRLCLALATAALAAGILAAGCHSNTVQVVAEDPDDVPELVFDILEAHSGDVSVGTDERRDWIFPGKRHRTTTIHVPPGSRVIVVASTQPRRDLHFAAAATGPATQPLADEGR